MGTGFVKELFVAVLNVKYLLLSLKFNLPKPTSRPQINLPARAIHQSGRFMSECAFGKCISG